jgi:predicted nucleic acid-binding protein
MILVDTSVWVDHFRRSNSELYGLLEQTQVVIHPWIIGELACGNLKNRKEILSLLRHLPTIEAVDDLEVLHLIEVKKIMGKGIGWVDAHLLAASLISGFPLWTMDKNLRSLASSFGTLY